ncbi:hypothetical protein [Sphingomonas sp.]|uniref:hypothetical protein n=1 Tax=Sphingomonas sp. TaxID=28214 RepID=UPI00307F283F
MNPLTFWLGVYLGGVVATFLLTHAEVMADDDRGGLTGLELASVFAWPILLPLFVIEVARGWRP